MKQTRISLVAFAAFSIAILTAFTTNSNKLDNWYQVLGITLNDVEMISPSVAALTTHIERTITDQESPIVGLSINSEATLLSYINDRGYLCDGNGVYQFACAAYVRTGNTPLSEAVLSLADGDFEDIK